MLTLLPRKVTAEVALLTMGRPHKCRMSRRRFPFMNPTGGSFVSRVNSPREEDTIALSLLRKSK
jgi:hypothetical protein